MGVHWTRDQDFYFHQAKHEGYRARSVYKLQEIQQKFHILKPGIVAVDLGAAPGSWTQYLAEVLGPNGVVVSVDRTPLAKPLPPQVRDICGDIFDVTEERLRDLAGGLADVVCSDMAPNTSGVKQVDHLRSIGLCERAMWIADRLLKPGGDFIAKMFQGGDVQSYLRDLKVRYTEVKVFKPKSSKAESKETFVIARGFKGAPASTERELPPTGGYDPLADR